MSASHLARAPYGSHNARVSAKRNRNAESAQNCRARVREMRKGTAMENKDIRAALDRHWAASDANNFDEEHQIYREDAVLEYPQSGERIRGRRNIQASRFAQPNKSASLYGGYSVLPTCGSLNSSSPTMGSRLTR